MIVCDATSFGCCFLFSSLTTVDVDLFKFYTNMIHYICFFLPQSRAHLFLGASSNYSLTWKNSCGISRTKHRTYNIHCELSTNSEQRKSVMIMICMKPLVWCIVCIAIRKVAHMQCKRVGTCRYVPYNCSVVFGHYAFVSKMLGHSDRIHSASV